jgi:hypothetical protein
MAQPSLNRLNVWLYSSPFDAQGGAADALDYMLSAMALGFDLNIYLSGLAVLYARFVTGDLTEHTLAKQWFSLGLGDTVCYIDEASLKQQMPEWFDTAIQYSACHILSTDHFFQAIRQPRILVF